MANKRIDVEIGVKNKIAAGLKSVTASLKRFGSMAGGIMKGVAVASLAVGAAIVALGIKAVKAFAESEVAEKTLIDAMTAHGDSVDDLLPKYKQLASAIQDETGIEDESTLVTIAKLRTIGVANDKMDAAIKLTLALGKAGMKEKAALMTAADAMNGNLDKLSAYIPKLEKAKTKAEKLALVNDLMTRGYKQLQGELDTTAGRWGEFKTRIGDVLEKIGETLIGGSNLKEMLKVISDKIKSFGESPAFDAFLGKVKNSIETITQLISVLAAGDVASKMQALASVGEIIKLGMISGAQQAANLMYNGLQAAWDMFHGKAMEGFKTYAKMLVNPVFAMQKYGEWAGKASVGGEKAAKNLFDVKGTDAKLEQAIASLKDQLKAAPVNMAMFDATKAKPVSTISNMSSIGPQVGGISDSTSMLSTGDLFSMMQTGSDSKATMVSEQQKTNEKLDKLIELSGGVE